MPSAQHKAIWLYPVAASLLLLSCPALCGTRQDAIETFLRAKSLLEAGDYEQCVEPFETAAAAFGELGDERLQANCWYNMTLAYVSMGRLDKAEEYCDKALAVFLRLGREMEIAGCRRFLGVIREAQGRPEEALQYLQQAAAVFAELGLRQDVASCRLNAGNAHKALGQYEQATAAYSEALGIYTELGMEAEQASCHNNLAAIQTMLGQYREAIAGLQRCLEIYERLQLPSAVADTWSNLGATYGDMGQYEVALEHHSRALEVYRRLKLPRDEANCLYNHGVIYANLGLFSRSVSSYAAAVGLYESLKLPKDVADCRRAAGWAYERLEDTARAAEMYGMAREVFERLNLPREQAICAASLAGLMERTGRQEQALELHADAAALFEALGLVEELGAVRTNLGATYCFLDRFEESIAQFEAASLLYRRAAEGFIFDGRGRLPGPMYAVEAGLGTVYLRRGGEGDLYRAFRHYARAIHMVECLRSRGASVTELKTAYFARMSWVYDEMVAILLRMRDLGLPLAPADLGETEPVFWQELGMEVPPLWRGWGSFEEAMVSYADCSHARALQELLANREVALADEQTRGLHRRWTALLAQERTLQRAQSTVREPEATAQIAERLQAVTHERETVAQALFATTWGRVVEPGALTLQQVEALLQPGEAVVQFTIVQGLVIATVVSRPADGAPAGLHAYGTQTAGVREHPLWGQTEKLHEDQILSRLAELQLAAAAQDGLPPGMPGIASSQALTGEFGICELVWLFRHPMVLASRPGEGRLQAEDMQGQQLRVAAALYSLLLRPLEDQLQQEGITGLAVVPDDALYYLPMGALVSRLPEDIDDIAGGRLYAHPDLQYAMERRRISVLPSVGMYAGMLAEIGRSGAQAPSRRICAFADAVFGAADSRAAPDASAAGGEEGREDAEARPSLDALGRLAETIADAAGEQLVRLANTREEARAALAAFGADDSAMVEDPREARLGDNIALLSLAAREPMVYEPELSQYGYLLFSTHGVIDPIRPEFSFIALTGGRAAGLGAPGSADDGRLMLPEAFGLRLRARVVTLSACRTAEGDYQAGEGILGLSAAMFVSGAQAVTASLWSVDDSQTARLIGDYHGRMGRGDGPAEALRQAQLAVLRQARAAWVQDPMCDEARYAGPFYWAPFVVMGRW